MRESTGPDLSLECRLQGKEEVWRQQLQVMRGKDQGVQPSGESACVIRPLNQWKASGPIWPDPATTRTGGLEWGHNNLTILAVLSGSKRHSTSPPKGLFCVAQDTGAALKDSERHHPVSTDLSASVSSGYHGTWTLGIGLWLLLERQILRAPLRQALRGLCLRLRLEPFSHSLKTLPTEPMKRWYPQRKRQLSSLVLKVPDAVVGEGETPESACVISRGCRSSLAMQ